MRQSLHTLVEVGTGGIKDELLVSSARMFLPRVRIVSVWVPQHLLSVPSAILPISPRTAYILLEYALVV
jgi:hypothetical protein